MPSALIAPPQPQYLTTGQAAAWLATKGIAVTRQTVRNWMAIGCVRQGRRIYLRHLRVRGLITRRKWIREYLESAQRVPETVAAPLRAETLDAQTERFEREKQQAMDLLKRRRTR